MICGPVVGDFGLLLVLPGIGLAALADALVVAPDGVTPAVLDAVDERRLHLLAAVRQHAVAGREPHERRLAGAERHGQHGQQVIVDAEALGVVDDDRHAEVLRKPHRHLVARVLDAEAQGRGAGGVLLLVVLRLPDILVRPLLDLDGCIEHDRRRLVAVVDRGRVDEWLERGAGLALGLDSAVELAHGEGKAADVGEDAACVRIHRDDSAADLGDLHQRPDAAEVLGIFRRDVDHVAERQHVADRLQRRLLGRRLRPLHLVEADLHRLAFVDERCRPAASRAAGRRSPWSARSSTRCRAARAGCRPGFRPC